MQNTVPFYVDDDVNNNNNNNNNHLPPQIGPIPLQPHYSYPSTYSSSYNRTTPRSMRSAILLKPLPYLHVSSHFLREEVQLYIRIVYHHKYQ